MNHHACLAAGKALPVDACIELGFAENATRGGHEGCHDLELGGGERNRRAAFEELEPFRVKGEVAHAKHMRAVLRGG
ncbi:hypothetical protein B5G21_01725 [Enorma massiliensis]|uniref:Uncharacterized protein n=1 Tax=Enorma massiliensis TaxID=1472761 RepID=A0A1Y3U7A9_9ACTN|nr:hypothetical protein B5G21_01725 [Enorma massiliensis]